MKHTTLPYWNERCKTAVYARNRARNKLNKNRTNENIDNYKRWKGVAQKAIKEALVIIGKSIVER